MSRKRNTTRLHFTEEERASPEPKKPIQKAEKAADRVEQVKKKARLQFESDAPKPPSKLSHEVKKAPGRLLSEEVHRNIRESEDENVGIQAAHGTEQAAETALHMGESAYHAHKLKPQRELYKEEQKLDQANVDALYKQSLRNDPQDGSNPMSRYRQKQAKVLILDEPTAGLDPKERVRFRNLLSEYAGDKIVILSTHIVSDIEAIADEVLLMKKGRIVQRGTVPELVQKAQGRVWELAVSPREAQMWQAQATMANLRHEGNHVVLRIVSDKMPSQSAVSCSASLEDLYLYYFPTDEGAGVQ